MGPRLKLPRYVHGFVDRHGHPRFYFRRAGFKQVALPGLPYSPEFMAAYDAALNGAQPIVIGESRTAPGTVDDAMVRYFGSVAFAGMAPSTQAMRRAILERFRVAHGAKRIRMLQTEHVARMISGLKPFAQRNLFKTLRGLLAFAVADGLVDSDPTAGVKLARVKDTGGHETWPEKCIELYRAKHPLGTRPRLALELLYGTMQRRGDVVRLGRQHIQHGVLSLRQQKTGVDVDLPVLPELQAAIDAMPKAEHLTFLVTELGKPFTAAGFGNWFRDQCETAGVPKNLSAHGLRKAGATRLAEHGCSDHELMAWGGWKTLSEVQRYTKAANRKRLAIQAAEKLKSGTQVATLETRVAKKGEKP
jgi:integrase